MKKIAVIGSGIAGTSAAYYLSKNGYDVTIFESGSYFGGHTNTIDVQLEGHNAPIDTGFLVHNDRTYPNLINFFNELKIETHPSEMTFSVIRKTDNLTWAGTNIFTVFIQLKNIFSPRFFSFLREVLKFNKKSKDYFKESEGRLDWTLGDLLKDKGYSSDFQNWYLLPMGGCIWSTPVNEMLAFPAFTFLRFCMNHGLLQITDRPKWKTVLNGCRSYVQKALSGIDKKYLNEPVLDIVTEDKKVKVVTKMRTEIFDYCVMCTHPPETLKIFQKIDPKRKEILANFKYQKNIAILHTDESVLPTQVSARAAWNYLSIKSNDGHDAVSVSYLINKLQSLPFATPVIVTLNPVTKINPEKIIKEIHYEHPLFSTNAIKAQDELASWQGVDGVYFAGAWMRYGFHEDGILAAKTVVKKIIENDGRNSDGVQIL